MNKPVEIGYNTVRSPAYDNLNLEKVDYIKYFGDDCVDWSINEMLKREGYMTNYFKNEIEINLHTIPKNYDQNNCWLCEKEFRHRVEKENQIVKDHCQLTGKFRGLAHNNCNLKTQKAYTSFVPILFHNFLAYDCHIFFEKLVNVATEKNI